MASIDEIICREINPFDRESLVPGNFWQERQDAALAVNSIHELEIKQIEANLNLVEQNNISRTILLTGDTGSGKSYLLARLKRSFNDRAFFAYIGPWPDSKYIWRHTLRQTVESLLYKPEGKQESQLLLWLKGLSAFRSQGFAKKIFGERRLFIKNLCDTYPTGIVNARRFFGVLYDLTQPDLYYLACDWLKGEDLDEEDLKKLNLKRSLESEEDAKNILGNFGKISTENQPIVLCFDQLDAIPRIANEYLDFQALFNINSTIRNHKHTFKNYLIIISVITSTWKRNYQHIEPADLTPGRVNSIINLKLINIQQAEALWTMRLHSIHAQSDNYKQFSPLYPLSREQLKLRFPTKTKPRNVLLAGHELYQIYKNSISQKKSEQPQPVETFSTEDRFELLWQKEYQKVQQKITKITLLSSPELITVLREVLMALEVSNIKERLITGKYDIYSFSYLHSQTKETIGIVWNENANMTTFFHVMKASQKAIERNRCQTIYLIRSGNVGHLKLKGNQIYRQIFLNSSHTHIEPSLSSLHDLATYYKLSIAAKNQELMLQRDSINLKQLQELVRKSGVLKQCKLLQDLGIINIVKTAVKNKPQSKPIIEAKEYLYNLVLTNHLLAKKTLIERTTSNFIDLKESQIDDYIVALCRENKIKFVNPQAKSQEQLICLIPQEDAV